MGLAGVAGGVGATASAASAINGMSKGSSADSQASAQDAEANAFKQKAADLWDNLNLPTLNTTPFSGQSWLQDYAPEAYNPYVGTVSQMSDDPVAAAQQQRAITQLGGLSQPGLLPSDLAQLTQIQRAQAGAESSAGQTAADALQQRGLGGAGSAYAAQLSANQNSANNANSLYNQALQTALQRQLAATSDYGTMAGNQRQQSAGISQAMAGINNQFNSQVQNLRTAAAQNAANVRNQAQSANLAGRQAVANQNIATGNQNLDRANQLAQQDFTNQQTKISGQSNAYSGQASQALAESAASANRAAGEDASATNAFSNLAKLGTSAFGGNGGNSNSAANNYGNPVNSNSSSGGLWDNLFGGGSQNYIDSGSFDV